MDTLTDKSVVNLIDRISSNDPVPGGGAVSALSASIAVSLCEMVVGLTKGKKVYNEATDDIKNRIDKIGEEARELKGVFLNLFERDNLAFEKVMDAFKLPKGTDEEKEIRKKKIEESYIGAMEVPLEVAKKILTIFDNIEFIVKNGNQNCITDAGVSSLQAYAAIQGSILNVKINLSGISDAQMVEKVRGECDVILEKAAKGNQGVLEYINSKV
jgi:formiminotetrahydrofolate cyclodeaminase